LNKEILRAAIIAELDAVNLYEQMAALTDDKHIKTILLEIAKEEKTHVGEFQTLLLMNDKQQEKNWLKAKRSRRTNQIEASLNNIFLFFQERTATSSAKSLKPLMSGRLPKNSIKCVAPTFSYCWIFSLNSSGVAMKLCFLKSSTEVFFGFHCKTFSSNCF